MPSAPSRIFNTIFLSSLNLRTAWKSENWAPTVDSIGLNPKVGVKLHLMPSDDAAAVHWSSCQLGASI